MHIVTAAIVSYPFIVPGVDVRKVRVAFLVHINVIFMFVRGMLLSYGGLSVGRPGSRGWSRTASRNMSSTNARGVASAVRLPAAPLLLCKRCQA
jgi:hypothetical protein